MHSCSTLSSLLALVALVLISCGETAPGEDVAAETAADVADAELDAQRARELAELESDASPAAPVAVTPPSAAPPTPVASAHKGLLRFAELAHDFGKVSDVKELDHSFEFWNEGSDRLEITNVKASCGCTTPALTKTVFEPGEGHQIDVNWKPKGFGSQSQTVTINTDSASSPVITLRISAVVEPFLTMQPPAVRFGSVRISESHTQRVTVTSASKELVIDSVTAATPLLNARLIQPAIDGRAEIEVTLKSGATWGMFFPKVTILARKAPGAEQVSTQLSINAWPYREIALDPPYFGVGRVGFGSAFEKALMLSRPTGEPFQILQARVENPTVPQMEVRVEPVEDGSVRLVLFGRTGDFEARFNGATVVLQTDVPGDPQLIIPVMGIVGGPVK